MLEDFVGRFKTGYKISYEAVEHRMNPEKSKVSDSIHASRIEALNQSKDPVEAFGYLVGIGVESLRHPMIMYRIMTTKEKD